jgi:gamma-glutamylcyclotransferase
LIYYFAYGSNMSTIRISSRIPIVKSVGTGKLIDYKLLCNKKSFDGTGKANIIHNPGYEVWGVIYRLDVDSIHELDRIEDGYERKTFKIITENEVNVKAEAYISNKLTTALPEQSYKNYIMNGAIEHKLPKYYIDHLTNILIK